MHAVLREGDELTGRQGERADVVKSRANTTALEPGAAREEPRGDAGHDEHVGEAERHEQGDGSSYAIRDRRADGVDTDGEIADGSDT